MKTKNKYGIISKILSGILGTFFLVLMYGVFNFHRNYAPMMSTMTHEQLTSVSATASLGVLVLGLMGVCGYFACSCLNDALEVEK